MPFLPTLKGYRRSWLVPDLTAGLTLVAIAIPEQVATAHLAGMPAVTGFYAFVAGSLVFAVLGRHPRMSVGADSTIAPVFAAGVATVAATGSQDYAHLVSMVALVAGGLLVAAGLLRLGWIADFLPLPVIDGLLAGIGTEIFVKQLPIVLGLPGGGTTTIGRARAVIDQLGQANGWTFGIAAGVLAVVIVSEKVDHRIPGALIAVVAATALVGTADLQRHGVRVLGPVHASFPALAAPSATWNQVSRLVVTAVTVGFLCIVQISATVRSSPSGPEERARDFNIDLAAVGAGSILAGLAGSFAVDASPPRTAVVGSAGGKTQVSSLVAVGAIVAVLALATSLLKDLPEAALGAILIFVASRLFHLGEMRRILRFGWFEFVLAVVTLAAVVVVGIEPGVVAAALLALAYRTKIAARPRGAVLGREPGTEHWILTDVGQPTEQLPGVLVYLLYGGLFYANAAYVVQNVRTLVSSAPTAVNALVLDAIGMSDIDYTGAKALGGLIEELKGGGVLVVVARASHLVHHDLKHAGLIGAIGADRVFASVEEAVRSLDEPRRPGPPAAGP
jgi:MFS superfamily sulfate permease-like transporter